MRNSKETPTTSTSIKTGFHNPPPKMRSAMNMIRVPIRKHHDIRTDRPCWTRYQVPIAPHTQLPWLVDHANQNINRSTRSIQQRRNAKQKQTPGAKHAKRLNGNDSSSSRNESASERPWRKRVRVARTASGSWGERVRSY